MNEKRLHIAVICRQAGSGGSVANVAVRQARELTRWHRITLISDSFPGEACPEIRTIPVRPKSYRFLRRFAHVPAELSFARCVREELRSLHSREAVDVALCHGHVVAAKSLVPLKHELGVPIGMVVHGDIARRPKGTYDPRLTRLYERTARVAYRAADLIVALSPAMAESIQRQGARPEAVRVIPNGVDVRELGVDPEDSQPVEYREGEPLRILYVGSLLWVKGVDILLRACGELKQKGVAFFLTVVGEGPLRAELQGLVRDLGLDGRVGFQGKVNRVDLGRFYLASHLVCVPSRSESLPTVVLEAMVLGRPVVGSRVEGIPYLVEEGISGLLFEWTALGDLTRCLELIAAQRAKVETMGRKSLLRSQQFRWDFVSRVLSDEILAIARVQV